jgi:hypothetical protein
MSFYSRDDSLPYWQSNVDVDSLFAAHAQRPDRAQAWLHFRSEHAGLDQAVMMRGHFEQGILSNHAYRWTFTPTFAGGLAIVPPVYDNGRICWRFPVMTIPFGDAARVRASTLAAQRHAVRA